MNGDPCLEILGVPETSDPRDLLGLPPGDVTASAVEAALLERIDVVFSRTDARAGEAQRVRRVLRDAARGLLEGLREPRRRQRASAAAAPPHVALTDFDRRVLAVLIGSGGWNAQSRARLVSLAADYGVTVQGLQKVMTGLSEYARGGGRRLGTVEISAGLNGSSPAAPAAPVADDAADREWIDRVAPELRGHTPGAILKLAMFFGLLTIFCGIVAWRVLFAPLPTPPEQVAAPAPAPAEAPVRRSPPRAAPPAASSPRLATYRDPPTFRGQALTAEAAAAADDCPQLVGEIGTIGRRISVADDPSDAVYRGWEVSLDTAATGWVLVDERLLEHIGDAVLEGLYAASDSPSVTDRLLAVLTPPARLDETVDVWRGAWNTGTLARVASGRGLPPAVVQRARILLELALDGPLSAGGEPFRAGAAAWLDRIAVTLVDGMEFNPRTYDLWEFWIAAQRRLGRGQRYDAALMNAVELILATSTDLAREGPSVNVLGRLVGLVDFQGSPVVRQRFLALFDEDSGIDSRDLWVVSSLLARSDTVPWFGEDLVLADDADWIFRRRIADRIADRWPESASQPRGQVARLRGIAVDPDLATRWLALFTRIDGAPLATGDASRISQLLLASRLNEVAVRLVVGDADEARRQLALLERRATAPGPAADPPAGSFRPAPPRGAGSPGGAGTGRAASGRDGKWAVAWEEAGRRVDERLQLLGQLRNRAGEDLDPVDAEVFVRVVYRAMPAEVRTLARDILVEQFGGGPTVAMEMLDQFPDAAVSRATTDLIRRLTGRRLPAVRSESWAVDVRLALVRHALDLVSAGSDVDVLMQSVHDSYDGRRACLDADRRPSRSAALAAAELAEAWRRRASSASAQPRGPGPGEEAELQRRHATRMRLAEGPLQRFVAGQLALLEQMAAVAAAEQAPLRDRVHAVLNDSSRRRSGMTHVLAQAVEAERAMARLWSLQMAVREPEDST